MNCPKCSTFNDDKNAFCVKCGEVFRSTVSLPPTMIPDLSEAEMPTEIFPGQPGDNLSEPTVIGGQPPSFNQPPSYNVSQAQFNQPPPVGFQPSMANFNPSIPFVPQPPPAKSSRGLWIAAGALLLVMLCGAIGGLIYWLNKNGSTVTEALPDHFGMFVQNADKTAVEEIKKQDFTNGFDAKEKILKDDSVPALESKPNLILYSDGKDIPLADLKLIQLDSVKTDGTIKQLDFKATPIEGKPEMKRLWFSDNLAKGKYAFAVLDGFFDDGKHRFWAFQVKDSESSSNDNLHRDLTVSLKNKSTTKTTESPEKTATPKPKVEPPVGARTAFAGTNNLVIRSAPSLSAPKVGSLRRGQKIYVLGYSDNYDKWNGLEGTWANIQTETGQRGWVFSPLLKF